MNYFLKILCESKKEIEKKEILHFIEEGCYFETSLQVKIVDLDDENWSMEILYNKLHEPIKLHRFLDETYYKKDLEELKFIFNRSRKSVALEKVAKKISNINQVYSLQIIRDDISEDCWEMLDALEVFIIKNCNGILYTSDNIFYNKNLKKVYKL